MIDCLQGFFAAAQRVERGGQVVVSLGNRSVESQGFTIFGDRRLELPAPREGIGQVVVHARGSGAAFDGAAIAGHGLFRSTHRREQGPAVVERFHVAGIDAEDFVVRLQCFIGPAGRFEGHRQVVARAEEPGLQSNGLAKGVDRSINPVERAVTRAQVAVVQRRAAALGDRLANEVHALRVIRLLMSRHAQEVQGVGMSWVDANDLAIKGLGLLDFARFVILDRAMQRLRDRSHRIPFRP